MVSKIDQNQVGAMVTAMHKDQRPQVKYRSSKFFEIMEAEMLSLPYQSPIARLKRLTFLYSGKYVKIATTTVGKLKLEMEDELLRLRMTVMTT